MYRTENDKGLKELQKLENKCGKLFNISLG